MTTHARYEIVVVGSINTDYIGRGSTLPSPGATSRGGEFYAGPGGKGANQAVAAARLGARVAMVGAVGPDRRGQRLIDGLRAEGVNTDHVRMDPRDQSGAAVIQVDRHGQKQILVVPGANGRLSPTDVHAAEAVLCAASVVVAQLEIPIDAVAAGFEIAHGAGARVILDPAPAAPLPDDLLRLVDVIRPNAEEAAALTGVPVRDLPSARAAAQRLLGRGVGAVAIGLGAQGNLVVWPEGESWCPGIEVRSVDATGAGDAFVGAFATRIARGESLADAGRFANAAAALATTRLGGQTGLPTLQDMRRLLAAGQPSA